MKKIVTFLIILLVSGYSWGQITVTGSNTKDGTYTSLTSASGAFAALNSITQAGRTIVITITGNSTSESGANTLTGAAGMWTKLTIYPTGSGYTISGAFTGGLISLAAAQNVTIDGRVNATGSTKDLTISNTQLNTAPAISFTGGASNDTIRYCNIKSRNNATTSGTIFFGTGANNNNVIDNCDVCDGTSMPFWAILSTTGSSSNNTISNCNIYNFSNNAEDGAIFIGGTSSDWTITNNNIYQVGTRTYTAGSHYGIWISNTAGNNFTITNNNIGGSSANCGTTAWTIAGAVANRFVAIHLNVGTTTASTVEGNTIANFIFNSSSGATTLPGVWGGIYLQAGKANIGTTTGNTIGGTTGTGSIQLTISTTGGVSMGIGSASTSTFSVSNNKIGSITVKGSTVARSQSFNGIWTTGAAASNTISGNVIGSTSTANSINYSTAGTGTTAAVIQGILNSGNATTLTISNNTIANINNAYVPSVVNASNLIKGISSSAGVNSITGNNIYNLGTAANVNGTAGSASVIGISMTSTTTGTSVSQNTIYGLSNTHASGAVSVSGIYYAGATTGTNVIARNFVYGLKTASSSASAIITGINSAAGLVTIKNNMVSLGLDAAGSVITAGNQIIGIDHSTVTSGNIIAFNSVYIGGTGVNTVAGSTYAFRCNDNGGYTRTFQNNIYENVRANTGAGGTHYLIRIRSTTGLTISHNDYYFTGSGSKFDFGGGYYATLALWQVGIGNRDANSIATDPLFNSPAAATPNLHLTTGSPCEATGTAIGAITDDFDGDTRSSYTPTDMGADAGNFNTSPEISVGSLTAFGNVCLNTAAGPNSFTISGTNLTTANVDVAASSCYTYCTTSGGTYTSTLSIAQPGGTFSQTIYVKFTPTSVASYTANIVVSGGGATSKNVTPSGSGVNSVPTLTAGSAGTPTPTTCTVSGTISTTGCTSVTAYGIEYSTTNSFGNGTGTAVASSNISGGNFSSDLTGLAQSTTYYFHTYATNSGGTGYGTQGTFTTPCGPASIPYTEGFESGFTANSEIIDGTNCYTLETATTWYVYSKTSYPSIPAHGGDKSATLWHGNSKWLFKPVNLTSGTTYSFQMYVLGSDATSTIAVSYGNSATSGAMSNTIVSTTTLNGSSYQLVANTFTPSSSGTFYIGFYAVSNGSWYTQIDDISIDVVACAFPTSLTSSNLQQTTATIGWTAASPAPANGYDYYVSTSSTAPVSGTTPTGSVGAGVVSADLTSLSASTLYYFWVRSNCGGSTSTWTGPSTFNTACGAAAVPITEGFESGFSNGVAISGCYTQQAVSGSDAWLGGTSAGGYLTPNGGTYAANLWHDNTRWLFINVALTSGVTYNLSLYAKTANNGSIEARYGTTGSAAGMASGSNIISSTSVGTSYAQYSGTYTPSSTGTYYIGIKGTSNTGSGSYLAIDDIALNCVTPSISAHPSASTQMICINGTPTDLSVTASPATAYQWYSNGSASNSGGSSIDGATSSTYTPVTTSAVTLYYYCVVSNGSGCTATSNVSGAIIVNAAGSWMGTTSTDWNTASNWCGGSIPTSGTNVIIPSGTSFSPSIGASGGVCNNITINSGATLTISGSNALTVSGNWSNSGTFTANSSTVTFDGATPSITGATTFNNVAIAGSGAKTITTANFTVNGILSMESTGTLSNAPTYGASATLQYNTATGRNSGVEWITPFAASGGVIIGNTGTITLTEAKVFNSTAPLTINSGSDFAMSTYLLTLNGDLVNNGGTTSGSGGVTITGTAAQSIGAFTTTGTVSMTKTAGTASFTGNVNGAGLTINGIGGTLNLGTGLTHTFTSTWTRTNGTLNGGSSTLKLGAGFSGTGGTFTANSGTVEWNASGAQTMAVLTYNNLTVSGSGAKTGAITTVNGNFTTSGTATTTTSAALTIGGNLSIGDGTTFTVGAFTLAVTGTTTIGSGTSGTLSFSSATNPNKTFTGLVTINNGASWSESAAITPSFYNGITNSGTFTASTGIHTFSTNSQALTGTLTIPSVTVTTVTLTNNGTLTVATALAGSGGLTNAATGTLNLNFATVGISTLTADAIGNTVNYGRSNTQTVKAITYHHLTLSGTSAKTLTSVSSINGDFTMSGSATATTVATMTIGGDVSLSGTSSLTTGAALSISGNITVGAGTTFTNGAFVLSVTGTTNLNGGTFSTGATGNSETVGTLTLSENSIIALGTGNHTLTFSGAAPAWTGGKTLTITGWSGTGGSAGGATASTGKIQVGAGNLDAGQLSQVSFSGYPTGATITASGELVPSSGAAGATFYSKSSSTPETESNWNTATDGSGMDAVTGDFTRGNIFVIQNGHTMTTAATWSISGTGSKLQIANGGILQSTFAITVAAATTFQIDNGGTYIHDNTTAALGSIYAGTESFGSTSNVRIDKWINNTTVITTGVTLPFGNLEINWTANANNWQQSWSGTINLCNNLTITSAGTGTFRFTANGAPTVNITGNYTQTGGTIDLASSAGSTITVNIGGSFTHTGGSFTKSGTGTGTVVINGTGNQAIESTGQSGTITFTVAPTGSGTVEVAAGKTFVDGGATTFNVSNTSSATEFTVNGTFTRTSSVGATATGSMLVSATGTYISNFATASLPTATWDAASLLQIDATIANGEFTESFGNVIFNNAAGCIMNTTASTYTNTIQGKLTLAGTGTVSLSNVGNFASTLTINGDLEISGNSTLVVDAGTTSGSITSKIIVNGDYIQNNGTLNISNNSSGTITPNTRYAEFHVFGNFTQTVGTITETANDPEMITRIYIDGTTSKTFTTIGQTGQVDIIMNKTGGAGINLSDDSQIDYNLTLTSGLITLDSYNLSLGSTATITGTPSSTKMIVATGSGQLRKPFSATGSYTFPVGDNDGTAEYSPVTVNVTSAGGFSSAYIGINLADAKHANNNSTTHYLTRYWNLNQSGITACVATITGTYINAAADVTGTLGSIKTAQLDGTFNQTSNPWKKTGGSVLSGTTLTYTGATITDGQTSVFTGITSADPSISIIPTANPICNGDASTLNTSATGDATLVYSWNPDGQATANITDSPSENTTYTVTLTDANGITSTASQLITVNVAPSDPIGVSGTITICNGGTTTLTATGGSEGSGVEYEWGTGSVVGDNVIGGETNASFTTPSLSSNQTYWVRRIGNTACTNTTSGVSETVTVVAQPASPSLTKTPDVIAVCLGLNVSATNGLGSGGISPTDVVEYSTNTGSSWTPYVSGTDILSTTPGADIIVIRARRESSGSGCVNSAYNQAAWTVYELPTITINERCLSGSRKVELVGDGGAGSYSAFEKLGSGEQVSNLYTMALGSSANFRLKDSNGCWSAFVEHTAPNVPTTISNAGTSGQCLIRGESQWSHVLDGSNNVLVSILDNGNDLGSITANVFVNGSTSSYNNTYYLKRNYHINVSQQPTSPVTLRLYFTDAEYSQLVTASTTNTNNQDDIVSMNDLKVTKYHKEDGTMDDNYANNDFNCAACFTVLTPVATGSAYGSRYIDLQISSFSELWTHGGSDPNSWLPIELLAFEPVCDGKNVIVSWLTATERNNDYFTIERGTDGINFTEIARVNGSGNSNSLVEYSIIDSYKPDCEIYYRLKQTDFNGVETIFNPKTVRCQNIKENTLVVMPNPFKESISIKGLIKDQCLIEIYGSIGEKVYSNKMEIQGNTDIQLDFLQPGIYLMHITEPTGEIHTFKMLKN